MADWIITFITQFGYAGVFALMVAENLFPPIPSEIVLPFIGYAVAAGDMEFIPALFSTILGSLLGTSVWFLLGWFLPAEKLERLLRVYGGYIAITAKDFHRATSFFTRFEIPAVFFGRMIPAVRSVISIPAGSVRMKPRVFLVYTFLGTALWNFVLILIGYFLPQDARIVEIYLSPVANVVLAAFIILYLVQIIRFVKSKQTNLLK